VSSQSDPLLLASAPALMVRCSDAHATNERGTILFYHGFGANKESYLTTLAVLADAGFLAVGIDAVGHGARRSPDFDDAIAALPPGPQLEAAFLGMVRDTAREVPAVIDALADRGLAASGRIGVAGWSMGGLHRLCGSRCRPAHLRGRVGTRITTVAATMVGESAPPPGAILPDGAAVAGGGRGQACPATSSE